MMGKYSRDKGARGERLWRDVCREHGYDAERGCQLYDKGSDIADVIGLPGIHQEVKFCQAVRIREWMQQAIDDAGPDEMPIVAHKRVREPWLVTMRAEDWFAMYREWEAGRDAGGQDKANVSTD